MINKQCSCINVIVSRYTRKGIESVKLLRIQ